MRLMGFELGSRSVFSKYLPHCILRYVLRGGRRASKQRRSEGVERRQPVMVRQAEKCSEESGRKFEGASEGNQAGEPYAIEGRIRVWYIVLRVRSEAPQ